MIVVVTKEEFMYRRKNGIDTTVCWVGGDGQYKQEVAKEILYDDLLVCYDHDRKVFIFVHIDRASFINSEIEHKAADLYNVWGGD